MATLAIRREPVSSILPEFGYALDPFRNMRDLLRWDPFAELGSSWPTERLGATTYTPQFDVKETKDAYLFRADLPGVKEQDIEVTLNQNRLVVSGKRESEAEEKSETYYHCERSYGSFMRSFSLPAGVDADHCQAELKHGVLTINVPKTGELAAKKIAIRSEKTKA